MAITDQHASSATKLTHENVTLGDAQLVFVVTIASTMLLGTHGSCPWVQGPRI